MLAEHLRARRSFRAVSVGSRVPDAYYLCGPLRRYYAVQVSSTVSPTTALFFGLTGILVEASRFVADAYECDMVSDNVDAELHVVFSDFVHVLESSIESSIRASRTRLPPTEQPAVATKPRPDI